MNIVNLVNICTVWLLSQRDRWILWSPVAVGLGIAFYFSLHNEPPLFAGGLALAMLGAFYWPLSGRRPLLYLWLAAMLVAAGFTAAQVRTHIVAAPVLAKETYPLTVEGRVVEVDALPKAYRVVLDDIAITAKWPPKVTPERVRVKLKNNDPAVPSAGDIIRVRAVLLPLSAPVLPGAFDFQRHAFFKRLGATGYAIGNMEVVKAHDGGFFFEEMRHDIRTRIDRAIADRDTANIVTAFLIGESVGITEKTWDVIRRSGIAHLLAISGFHITVLAGFLFFGVRALLALSPALALRHPIKKYSAFLAMCGSIFYMLLIGSPVPAERAVIMCCVVMTAIMLDRDPFTLRLAAFAALVIMFLQPETLIGPSFQLSFAAVVALIAFYEGMRNWWSVTSEDRSFARRYSLYVTACLLTTLVATAATAPYALYHFSRVPVLSGIVANMIAVPVTSFVTFPFGLAGCLLMPLGLEHWPLVVAGKSIELVMAVAHETASWRHALFRADGWPAWILGVITLGGLWLCLWQGRARWAGLAVVVLGYALIPFVPRPDAMLSDNGKLFAVRDAKGVLWMSSARTEKFVRGEWEEREGGKGVRYPAGKDDDVLTCNDASCAAAIKGKNIAYVFGDKAGDACAAADIVFAPASDAACKAPHAYMKKDVRSGGAHAVYIDEAGNVTLRTTSMERGRRPWAARVKYRAEKAKKQPAADTP